MFPHKTSRLILRPFQVSDLPMFTAYRSDPEVARYQSWEAPYSLAQAEIFLEELKQTQPGTPGEWYAFAIERKSTPGIIGDCAFQISASDPLQAQIGYTLAREHWKQGYAAEAVRGLLAFLFQEFNLHRITAGCDVENTASYRLLERVGMRREANFIENIWFKGRWGSEYVYALLRSEWKRLQEIPLSLRVMHLRGFALIFYNSLMFKFAFRKIGLPFTCVAVSFILGLSACASIPITLPKPTPLHAGALIPYIPSSATPTPTFAVTLPAPTETPLPTPTPFTYTVKKGDTMLGIAFNYGLSLDQLLAANPTVQPRLLSVGTVLVIPLDGELPTAAPQPTSIPLSTSAPLCYSQADGGMWCFLPVTNDQAQAVENLFATISLVSPSGESLGSQPAAALLDLLHPSETLPLIAYFPAPVPAGALPQPGPLSALPVPEGDTRYLLASFQPTGQSIAADGLSARVVGQIILPQGDPTAESIWLAGVAYDALGQVVGVRKWEVISPCSSTAQQAGTPLPEAGCTPLPFEGEIYSLGPAIAKVEIHVEARP